MAEAKDLYGSIYQNLLDAGCDQQTVKQCMTFVKDARYVDMIPILTKDRKALLGVIHKGQEQINCLDYLLYKLKKM